MTMPHSLPKVAADCATFSEYREWVLNGQTQAQMARAARMHQAQISGLETGRQVPRRKHWPNLWQAYRMSEDEFFRMVQQTVAGRALRLPVNNDDAPLFAAVAGVDGVVLQASAEREAKARVG